MGPEERIRKGPSCISSCCTHPHLSKLSLQEAVITQHCTSLCNPCQLKWGILEPVIFSRISLRWGHVSLVSPISLSPDIDAGCSKREAEPGILSPSFFAWEVHLLHVTSSSLLFLPFSYRCMCVQQYCRLDRQHGIHSLLNSWIS